MDYSALEKMTIDELEDLYYLLKQETPIVQLKDIRNIQESKLRKLSKTERMKATQKVWKRFMESSISNTA